MKPISTTFTRPARAPRRAFGAALAAFAMLCATAAVAGELTAISWSESGDSPALTIELTEAAKYDTVSLEGGQRLRISFPNTTLGAGVTDISGRGNVKGVYPYLADNGTAVHIDLLLNAPGELQVYQTGNVFDVNVVAVGAGGSAPATAAAPAPAPAAAPPPVPAPAAKPAPAAAPVVEKRIAIEDIVYTKLPGDRIQIQVRMTQPPPEPATFTISNPARISLDFPGTRVAMPKSSVRIAEGAVLGVTAVEAQDRTRVVVNLVRTAAYKTAMDGNTFSITVDNPVGGIAGTEQPKTTRFASTTKAGKHRLGNIDFRRGPHGDGKVIIGLSDTGIGIDIREQAGEIIVDFLNTSAPPELQRRLDVMDFATPIHNIDTYVHGKNVRMVITAKGRYEHLAYQAGNVFTVNVKPIVVKPGDEVKKDEFGYSGEKLSLNFQNIDVRAALQVIADFTGINFVTSDSVKGSLTLRLKDVPWDQALDIILDAKSLTARKKGNVISVGPADEVAAREKAALEAGKQVLELEPLVSELIQINYSKADDIAKLLKSIKPVTDLKAAQGTFGSVSVEKIETESNTLLSPRGQVTVDERTNSLLIQDTPAKIREIRQLIAQLDQPVRQVMIETRLVEATDDFTRNLGARWGTFGQNTVGNNIVTHCGTLDCNVDILNGDPIQLAGNALAVNLGANPIGTNSPGSIGFSLMHLPNGNFLSLELSALEAEGRGKIISSPRLITANQKKARIEQGQERVFVTSGGLGNTAIIKKAVLALEVTPRITPDDRIILDVLVTKDSFAAADATTINKKEITTQVLLENGETVVIGGIYEQQQANNITKVPYLADIPLVGWAFQKKNKFDNKVELLIFLTPRILSDSLSMR
ncbi:MAG TPA: type IV pilus secretin PilQ [Acidiferrobacterales bacterium]